MQLDYGSPSRRIYIGRAWSAASERDVNSFEPVSASTNPSMLSDDLAVIKRAL
jgi:hypothetical protein